MLEVRAGWVWLVDNLYCDTVRHKLSHLLSSKQDAHSAVFASDLARSHFMRTFLERYEHEHSRARAHFYLDAKVVKGNTAKTSSLQQWHSLKRSQLGEGEGINLRHPLTPMTEIVQLSQKAVTAMNTSIISRTLLLSIV